MLILLMEDFESQDLRNFILNPRFVLMPAKILKYLNFWLQVFLKGPGLKFPNTFYHETLLRYQKNAIKFQENLEDLP